MGNKILYRNIDGQHKFYGMVNVPEPPNGDDYKRHRSPGYNDFIAAEGYYQKALKACKSSALEIINPEVLPTFPKPHIDGWILPKNMKDGDIFDCPEGLEFEEEPDYCDHPACRRDSDCANCPTPSKFIRLVKTSKEESQEELWDEVLEWIRLWPAISSNEVAFHYRNKITIQRKKP